MWQAYLFNYLHVLCSYSNTSKWDCWLEKSIRYIGENCLGFSKLFQGLRFLNTFLLSGIEWLNTEWNLSCKQGAKHLEHKIYQLPIPDIVVGLYMIHMTPFVKKWNISQNPLDIRYTTFWCLDRKIDISI